MLFKVLKTFASVDMPLRFATEMKDIEEHFPKKDLRKMCTFVHQRFPRV